MAHAGACFVCLEASPPPIQMGCACRGDAGLAHIGCLIQAAASRAAHGSSKGWWECPTCKQQFTGAMQHGLAEGRWLLVRDQPAESKDRLEAASILAVSLRGQGKYAEAERMQRELLDVRRRVLGPEHPGALATVRNLASLGSIRSVSTSIGPFVSRTLTTSHPADSEEGLHSHEPRSSSAPPDLHSDAPPAKRVRR